jgi:hypothetical protein
MTIRRLKDLLKHHKIPLPADLASDPFIQSPQATIELFGFPNQQLRAQMPPPESYFPGAAAQQQGPNVLNPADVSYSNLLHSGSTTSASSAPPIPPISSSMPHPQGLGATQVGVDFVLALEHVCLEHHAEHSAAHEGSGHEMMLMSPIMWHSPARQDAQHASHSQRASPQPPTSAAQQPPHPSSGLPTGTRWSVPALELEKLLDFSDKLSLNGEITPVEAWQRIRQHPNFEGMTRDGLDALKETLLPEVTCYG